MSDGAVDSYDSFTGEGIRRGRLTVESDSPDAIAALAEDIVLGEGSFLDVRVLNAPVDWPTVYVRTTAAGGGDRYFEEVSTEKRSGWRPVRVPPGLLKTLARGGRRLTAREADEVPRVKCDAHGEMRPRSIRGRVVRYACDANPAHEARVMLP